jgi:ubiquinone/menaquinone biosynthesis C-methylase UbiE
MSKPGELGRGALAGAAIHEEWVSTYRTPEAQIFYEEAFDEIARRLRAPKDAVILDAGCGSCAKSILLATRGFKVVGADFSSTALELAQHTLRAQGLEDRVTLRQGDLLDLPFVDGEFPYVLCWGVLMHVPELSRALAQLARVLAPGGRLVLSEGNMYALQSIGMRALKRVLGRRRSQTVRVPAGLENTEATEQGVLLTRQTDMAWLVAECDRLGLRLEARIPGQFTELYALAPWPAARRLIHAFNGLWFHRVRWAAPAFGNILIFEKRS